MLSMFDRLLLQARCTYPPKEHDHKSTMLSSNGALASTFDPYEGRQEKNRICDFSEEVALHHEVMGQTTSIIRFFVGCRKEINLKAIVEVVSRLPSLSLDYHSVDSSATYNPTEPANFTGRMPMH